MDLRERLPVSSDRCRGLVVGVAGDTGEPRGVPNDDFETPGERALWLLGL